MQLLQTLRSFRRSPAFTTAAIATLALEIGANTAIFSLIDATLLEPLPYPDAERIVQIWFTTPSGADTNHSIMENLLFGVQPIDPTFIASSCLTLGAVAAPASHLTASRASLFDPARTPRAGL